MHNFFDAGDEFRLYGVAEADSGRPLLLAPLRYTTADYAVKKGHVVGSISNPENYTTAALIFDPTVARHDQVLEALFRYFREDDPDGYPRRFDAIRIWPFELDSPLGDTIHRALKNAGFIIQSYTNSFNRFEDTTGLTYEAYFEQRSANMRYNVSRRQRALEKKRRSGAGPGDQPDRSGRRDSRLPVHLPCQLEIAGIHGRNGNAAAHASLCG